MRRVNLNHLEFEYEAEDPKGFRSGMARFGPGFGAEITGASVYELPPGQALCPYHYEWGEEEWLLVLSGSPSLRDPEGTHVLEPMDLVFFPRGPEGAHRVQNDGEETAYVLMFSNVLWPTATIYPDSDKVGVYVRKGSPDNIIVRRESGVEYFDRET